MISIKDEFIYTIINENLSYIVSDDIISTHSNIKTASILTVLYINELYVDFNKLIPIEENQFFEYISTYFTDQVSSKLGRLFQTLFFGIDIGIGSLYHGSVTSITATALGGSATSLAIAGLLPILILVTGFAFYKYFKMDEMLNTKRLLYDIQKLSMILKFNIPESSANEFKTELEYKCASIKDKTLRLRCSANAMISYLNKYIFPKIISSYIKLLKDNNENLEMISTFNQLCQFRSSSNKNISIIINRIYQSYLSLLSRLLKDNKSIAADSFLLLNKITRSELRK